MSAALGSLTIDFTAIARNWRRLQTHAHAQTNGRCRVAGVVKANGYGLGARLVVAALAKAGCTDFFVATPGEAYDIIDQVQALPSARLFLLSGPPPGEEVNLLTAGIVPVLNSLDQIQRWGLTCAQAGERAPAILHADTGMNRLGLSPAEFQSLVLDQGPLAPFRVEMLMTHPACADDPTHPLNAAQREAFLACSAALPDLPTSYANSSALFGPPDCLGNLARPGIALYGGNPTPGRANPMDAVITLTGKILQIREIDTPRPVGYGATHRAARGQRLATVGVGYADGLPRTLSGHGMGDLDGHPVPMVGRVSMDMIVFDVSSVPPQTATPGAMITLIGPHHSLDALASEAGTIPYEILTGLGPRYERHHVIEGPSPAPQSHDGERR